MSQYWKDRAIELENQTHQISNNGYKELIPAFDKAHKEIQAKIDMWLSRIADNNSVTLERAKEMLDNKELKDFRMSLTEYINYGMENALNQKWIKELENASAKHHIDKLTALKMELEAEYQKLFNSEEQTVSETIKEAYKDRYYRTAYEFEKVFKIKNSIGTINEKKLSQIINKPWAADGSNFSDRIWVKKDQMIDNLYKELVRELVTGESLKDAIDHMTRFVNNSYKNAKYCAARLIQTEAAYFSSKSQQQCYNDLAVEEYEIVATLDSHTSDICRGRDGEHHKMSEYEAGVTAPPFHVFCRSTTCPYFNDEFTKNDERAARGTDEKTENVSAKLTYKEWLNKLEKDEELKYNKLIGVQTKDGRLIAGFVEHFVKRARERNVSVEDATSALQDPIYIDNDIKINTNKEPSIAYISNKAIVQLNPNDNYLITTWKVGQKRLKAILKRKGKHDRF